MLLAKSNGCNATAVVTMKALQTLSKPMMGLYFLMGLLHSIDGDVAVTTAFPATTTRVICGWSSLMQAVRSDGSVVLVGLDWTNQKIIRQLSDGDIWSGVRPVRKTGIFTCNQSDGYSVILYKIIPSGEIEWRKCLGSQVNNFLRPAYIFRLPFPSSCFYASQWHRCGLRPQRPGRLLDSGNKGHNHHAARKPPRNHAAFPQSRHHRSLAATTRKHTACTGTNSALQPHRQVAVQGEANKPVPQDRGCPFAKGIVFGKGLGWGAVVCGEISSAVNGFQVLRSICFQQT